MKNIISPVDETVIKEGFRELFRLAPGALFVLSAQGHLIECNNDACDMFGYTREEFRFLSARDLFHGCVTASIADMLVSLSREYVWMSCVKKGGLVFPVQCRTRLVDIHGQRIVLLGIIDFRAECCNEGLPTRHGAHREEDTYSLSMTWKKEGMDYVLIGYDKMMEQFTQGRISEFIGRRAGELYAQQTDFQDLFRLCEAGGSTINHELSYKMFTTGERKHIRAVFVPVDPDLIVTHFKDITKDTLLHESEQRRILALEATSDGVWDWNMQTGRIITCPSYFTMLGYDPSDFDTSYPEVVTSYDEFIGMVHNDDRDHILRVFNEYSGDSAEIAFRMKTKTGGWKWILKRGRVVERNERGDPLRMIGTHIDIDESRKAEDALKQSEERLKAQYMGSPVPTYTWQRRGEDFVLSDFNISTDEFTDGQIAEFIGKKAHTLYRENPEILDSIIQAFDKKTICRGQTLYRLFTTQKMKYITFTCAYVDPDMVLVHMEDITKQKSAEERLQRSEKDLRDLTAQLFKAEENVRKYIAQELHDSIGQHLSSIKYITEMMTNQIQGGHLDGARSSLDKLVSVIQNTIDEVSRISMDLRPSTLDDLGILATISWFCREYEVIYPRIDLKREIEIEERDVPAHIRIHLFRIIQESLNNVARHSKATRVRVSLTKNGGKVELAISDNGIGFDIEKKMVADQDGKRGFGLMTMKERTRNSGGVFSLASSDGKGTSICASWPCS